MAGVLLYVFPPASTGWYPRCPFHVLTGLHCPGCGSLRALHAILHGRLGEAFRQNPLLVAFLPFLAAWLSVGGLGALLRNRTVDVHLAVWMTRGAAILLALFFILRNIPVHPFTLLSP